MSLDYDPFSPRWRDDPYPIYRRLRDEAPVHFAPQADVYCISRYDDVLHVLESPDLFSSRAMLTVLMQGGMEEPPLGLQSLWFAVRYALRVRMNPFAFPRARNLISEDGDAHASMRNIVNRGFTPRRIQAWQPRIREIVRGCTSGLRSAARFDVMRDLAIPLPVTIIVEMLGVEPERRDDFKRWSDAVIRGVTGERRGDPFHPETVRAIIDLDRYLVQVVRRRRGRPADDLVSAILAEQEGETALTTMEVALFLTLLLVAGNETTTNLIGNAVNALLDHPPQLERAAADAELAPGLIEEALRYDPPIQIVFRNALRATEIAGTRIPGGACVALLLGSANRDGRRFPEPDRFDIARNPRGHLGFGFGRHFCLGASLARLEARAALETLVPELPRLERTAGRALVDSFLVRGPKYLELVRAA